MRQHLLDLLPETYKARTRARTARTRAIMYSAVGVFVVAAASIHARVLEERADVQLTRLESQAQQLERNEAQAVLMQRELDRLTQTLHRYYAIETPLAVTSVIATVIEAMPESATFLRIDLDADHHERARGGASAKRSPRELVVEIGGFTRSDREIAEFVSSLEDRAPFEAVSLDFSRQGTVNEVPSREFRLSFKVDFDRRYQIVDPELIVSAEATNDAE